MPQPLKVFISYSHKDRLACEELWSHLTPLADNSLIKVWRDKRTLAGEEWEGPINDNLNSAHIIILLLSHNFANSHYCKNIEMKRACERADNREARLIPILYDHFKWEVYKQIEKRKLLPLDAKPVVDWGENRNKVWKLIIDEIEKIIIELNRDVQVARKHQKSEGSLIPYQVNRHDQNSKVDESLAELAKSHKSILLIAHGKSKDRLSEYVSILYKHHIPGKTGKKKPLECLEMPVLVDNVITADHNWWNSVLNYLKVSERDRAVKAISRELAKNHYLIWFELKTSYLCKQPEKALQTCIKFAAELHADLKRGGSKYNPIYVITIDYDESSLPKRWFKFSSRDKQIRDLLTGDNSLLAADNLRCIVLPEMESVKKVAVTAWANTYREQLSDSLTKKTIDELYSGAKRQLLTSDNGILMEDLAIELVEYLKPAQT